MVQSSPELPHPLPSRNPSLTDVIQQLIRDRGPLPFSQYMALALYDPQAGYYARGVRQVGREGDFFTSVSIGPLFGQLLARRFLAEWQRLGRPAAWRITECGAHDGRLALDVLDALSALEPAAYSCLEYAISEPLESLRLAQRDTLHDHARCLLQVADAMQLERRPGVVFGNEVLDALPCELIERRQGHWRQCLVDCREVELGWSDQAITDPELLAATATLGSDFPEGYRTEVRTNYLSFLHPLAQSIAAGRMIWIDYGFERHDYYHPGRRTGTLRTFDHHQSGENPLLSPGAIDISAHVDFTAVSEAAARLGGRPIPIQDQGSWLTRLGRDWLLAQEGQPDPGALRQFQTLTHPGHLGRAFQVLEVEFG